MTQPFTPPEPDKSKPRRAPFTALRNSFLTGLVVIAPIGLTVWLLWTVIGWVDSFVLPFVPDRYMPEPILNRLIGNTDPNSDAWITVNLRGVGVVVFLVFTVLVGWIAKGIIGRSLINWAETLVDRMPVVRSIYNGLKQIAETVFAQSETNFDRACLVEYPRKGIWAIAFVSTTAKGEIKDRIPRDDDLVSVFLPTTPNPTSGFLLFVPEADIVELSMGVEDAAKLVISAGLVYPNGTVVPVSPDQLPERDRERISA